MVQFRGPTAFHEVAQLLIDNLTVVLAASLGGPVERACVVPGEIIWDSCNCGLLAISVRRWFLTDDFPDTTTTFGSNTQRTTPCDLPWLVAELHIQVVRCAPIPDGNAISVPCPELDTAAQILISDAYVTMTEVVSTLCALREDDQIIDYVVGEQETQGPAGDCVGSVLSAQIAIMR